MVYGQIVEGSPGEIAAKITAIVGDRRVKVYLINDANESAHSSPRISDDQFEKIMAEIRSDAVSVPHVDDSREGIYLQDVE